MYKMIRTQLAPDHVLKITIELSDEDNIAAQTDLKYLHKVNISRKKQLSSDQIAKLDQLISNVFDILNSFRFVITDKNTKQSSKSYSYYITFFPTDSNGNKWSGSVQVQFEVRDHRSKTHPDAGQIQENLFIKAFFVGSQKCFSTDGVLVQVKKICRELQKGNYDILLI